MDAVATVLYATTGDLLRARPKCPRRSGGIVSAADQRCGSLNAGRDAGSAGLSQRGQMAALCPPPTYVRCSRICRCSRAKTSADLRKFVGDYAAVSSRVRNALRSLRV